MKKIILFFIFLPVVVAAQNKAELAFSVPEKDLIPEGIAYNRADKSFYLGSIYKKKIVRIDAKGNISDFVKTGADGLMMVLGLRVDPETQQLWVCSNEGEGIKGGKASVHQYDLKSGKLMHVYTIQREGEIHLFNDLIPAHGKLYVTDSEFGAVYEVDPVTKRIDLFVKSDQLYYPNGIVWLAKNDNLVVSSGAGLITINVTTKAMGSIPFQSYYLMGSDGLYLYNNSLVAIQNVSFPITINRFYLDENNEKITRGDVLLIDEPNFDMPTTGAVAGDWFYFIANSQLRNYDKGEIKDQSKLKDVKIMRLKLK